MTARHNILALLALAALAGILSLSVALAQRPADDLTTKAQVWDGFFGARASHRRGTATAGPVRRRIGETSATGATGEAS